MTTKIINSYLGSAYYLQAPVTTLIVRPGGHVAGNADYGIVSPVGGASYSVANQGVVDGGKFAIYLRDGGSVSNGYGGQQAALIDGAIGIAIYGGPGTVTNLGTVESTGTLGAAVSLAKGGRLVNGSAANTSALLNGYFAGARAAYGDLMLRNFGTIAGSGSTSMLSIGVGLIGGGGSIVNGTRQDRSAAISGVFAVDLFEATAPVTNFGLIEGVLGIAAFKGAVSVRNLGTIEGAPGTVSTDGGEGVLFGAGINAYVNGSVVNGSNADESALIEGRNGLFLGAGTQESSLVSNFGTINGNSENGMNVSGPLKLTNGSTADGAALIEGGADGVSETDGAGTAINWGSIAGAGESLTNAGLYMGLGGLAVNNLGGVIQGANGVLITGAVGTVRNIGSISGASGDGVDLVEGGLVTNGSASNPRGMIAGASGVYIGTSAGGVIGTVLNFGTINSGHATHDVGVLIGGSGLAINGALTDETASIYGYNVGVVIVSGVVKNFGTIRSGGTTIGHGGLLVAGNALVVNGSAADRTALIEGPEGVNLIGEDSLRNFGTIETSFSGVIGLGSSLIVNGSNADTTALIESAGSAIGFDVAGTVTVTVTNFGAVESDDSDAIALSGGGRVTNGSASDHRALVEGAIGVGTQIGPVTVRNLATIEGTAQQGVFLGDGGQVINIGYGTKGDGALIEGVTDGVETYTFGTVTNQGTIDGDTGVYLRDGGLVTNGANGTGGLIEGADGVVSAGAAGTVRNFGLILARGAGAYAAVELLDGGQVINGSAADSGALLIGAARGVVISGAAGTVTNFGTIQATSAGGYAVQFTSAGSTLVVRAGSQVIGLVSGGSGVLDLASGSGALSSIVDGDVAVSGPAPAQAFDDFGTLEISAGSVFTLTGSGTIATGGVADLDLAGTLAVTGSLSVSGSISGAGRLFIEGGVVSFAGASSQEIAFKGAGQLQLADSQAFGGSIRGFTRTGTTSLDLEDIRFGGKTEATYSGTTSGGVLTVTDGKHTATIALIGNYLSSAFSVASNGADGTLVTDPAAAPALASAMAGFAPSPAAVGAANGSPSTPSQPSLARPAGS